jgi:hypothetical protein
MDPADVATRANFAQRFVWTLTRMLANHRWRRSGGGLLRVGVPECRLAISPTPLVAWLQCQLRPWTDNIPEGQTRLHEANALPSTRGLYRVELERL